MNFEFYAPDGTPIDLQEFERLFVARYEDLSLDSWWRRVTMVGKTRISTVWLGVNYQFEDEGPPLIWETMVFGDDGEREHVWRYSSREEALDHHEELLRTLKEAQCLT